MSDDTDRSAQDAAVLPQPDGPERTGMLMTVAVIVISVFGFLGKVAGYFKEILIAKYWGTSSSVDTFKVVYNSIIFLVYSKMEKLLRPTFLPIFVKHRDQDREDEALAFLGVTGTLALVVVTAITGLTIGFAPGIIALGWPEITGEYHDLAVDLLRIASGAMRSRSTARS